MHHPDRAPHPTDAARHTDRVADTVLALQPEVAPAGGYSSYKQVP